jgi:DNA-binding GntR family transcriptional regulator
MVAVDAMAHELRPARQKRQVLVDGVYDTLVTFLMSGTLLPGDPVGIDSLSRSLEVSPTPVREALARIEATGLVVREPLRGYRVAPRMSPKDLREIMEARILIEPYNAAAVCAHRSEELMGELSSALNQMRGAPTGPTYREFREFLWPDAHFHQIIAAHAGNHFLSEALSRLGAHLDRFHLFAGAGVSDAPQTILEHEAVFSAIEQGSSDKARKAMKRHLQGVLERAIREQQGARPGCALARPR